MKKMAIVPTKKRIKGEWSLKELFNFNESFTKKMLLEGRAVTPPKSDYTFKYVKSQAAILVTKKGKPYFSMNFWLSKGKVKRIEAYDKLTKKSIYPIPRKVGSGGIMKMPLVELGVNYKSARRALREMSIKGILKRDVLRVLGIESAKRERIALK
jgi:hypothetical protein